MPDGVLVDTSAVQYLHQLGLLDVLRALYGRVTIAGAVADELVRGRANGHDLPDLGTLPWLAIERGPVALVDLATGLGAGERELLALARADPGALLVLDDGPARHEARRLGLRVTGTLGVLLRAKQVGLVPLVAPLLERREDLGFRVDPPLMAEVLGLAGEGPRASRVGLANELLPY